MRVAPSAAMGRERVLAEIEGSTLSDWLRGNAGSDSIAGLDGDDTLAGAQGDDTLDGGAGSDLLLGGAGNDVFMVTTPALLDNVRGGPGDDTIRIDRVEATAFVILPAVFDAGAAGIERLDASAGPPGSSLHNIALTGQGSPLDWDLSHLAIGEGLAPNPRLVLSRGADRVVGTAGADSVSGDGNAPETSPGGTDTIAGADGADTLRGMGGNDVLKGGADGDWLQGGFGEDSLSGGDDSDFLQGGAGNDALRGCAGDDLLMGEDGADIIHAGKGDDSVSGGLGNDRLRDIAGDDTLSGGDGQDTIRGRGESTREAYFGGNGSDRLFDALDGSAFLYGEAGNDTLRGRFAEGGAGDDLLDARHAADALLSGGGGTDRFLLGLHDGGRVVVENFLLGDTGAVWETLRIDVADRRHARIDIPAFGGETVFVTQFDDEGAMLAHMAIEFRNVWQPLVQLHPGLSQEEALREHLILH